MLTRTSVALVAGSSAATPRAVASLQHRYVGTHATHKKSLSRATGVRKIHVSTLLNASASTTSSFENELAKLEAQGNYKFAHRRNVFNSVLNIVPQQEAYVVERFGKYSEVLQGGMHFLIPFIDRIAYAFSLKEEALIIPNRAAITQDNVRIHVVGVLYFRVVDPKKAAYGAGDPIFALSQLAQTTLRSILGEMTLDETFHERDKVNKRVVQTCNEASSDWGMLCLRHEIREIIPPENVLHAMEMQVEAERRKRVEILQSEGRKQSEINTAEGHKRAQILTSEAKQQQNINEAIGAAEAVRLNAEAEAKAILARAHGAAEAIERLGLAVSRPGGKDAVTFQVAIKYVEAFEKLAKNSTTLILPSNAADVASMISQATTIFGKLQAQQTQHHQHDSTHHESTPPQQAAARVAADTLSSAATSSSSSSSLPAGAQTASQTAAATEKKYSGF